MTRAALAEQEAPAGVKGAKEQPVAATLGEAAALAGWEPAVGVAPAGTVALAGMGALAGTVALAPLGELGAAAPELVARRAAVARVRAPPIAVQTSALAG